MYASYTGRDGRVRRSRSLPRPVREPLPARLPGEVQGLGPRRLLVAAESARADGGVPRRLRPAVEGELDPALPAVPARRPCVLDLLRHVAADRGTIDDRQR